MAHIRTFAELQALEPTEAEQLLIDHAKTGTVCTLDDGSLPEEGTPDEEKTIRAEVLRYLILGGCDACKVDQKGLRLVGGHISGALDLSFHSMKGALWLRNCRFDHTIQMEQFTCGLLAFSGSSFTGIRAPSLIVSGSLFLRDTIFKASLLLQGAKIGGALALERAQFLETEQKAINAQAAEIEGGVFLFNCTTKTQVYFGGAFVKGQFFCVGAHLADKNGYALSLFSAKIEAGVFLHPTTDEEKAKVERPFIADGGITLSGSKIGFLYADHVSLNAAEGKDALTTINLEVTGPVHLRKTKINGEVRLAGSKISGNLDFNGSELSNGNGHALNAQRIKVDQRLIWKNVNIKQGAVSLNGAHVAELDDDPENWPCDADALLLDGFTYDRIRGKVSTSTARDAWLKNGSLYKDQFFPQPYTQYAKFLRETGHDSQARKILLTRETLVRKYERKEMHWLGFKDLGFLKRPWRGFWDRLQWVVVGHGHAPFWSIGWLALLIFLATIPAHRAWEEGSFAPNASPIIVSNDWQALQVSEPNPAKVWSGDLEPANWRPNQNLTPWKTLAPGRDWETFNRYAYAADIVIPLINFGQTDAWAPSTTRGDWGWHLWWLRWVFTVFGWIVTALGAAAITGIIRRD